MHLALCASSFIIFSLRTYVNKSHTTKHSQMLELRGLSKKVLIWCYSLISTCGRIICQIISCTDNLWPYATWCSCFKYHCPQFLKECLVFPLIDAILVGCKSLCELSMSASLGQKLNKCQGKELPAAVTSESTYLMRDEK